jgi:OmpA-OmpF porin, OOP family
MATNLLEQVSREFSWDIVNRISEAVGENTSDTQISMDRVLKALTGGLALKASTSQGANELVEILKRNNFDSNRFQNVASALSRPGGGVRLIETGGPLLQRIFGAQTSSIVDWVSSLAGIRKASSSSLLSLALPVVLGQVGRLLGSTGWSASNLMNLFSGQRSDLEDLPAGLASALSGGAYWTSTRRVVTRGAYVGEPPRRESTWRKWALPLLALLAMTFLLSRFFSGREEQVQMATLNALAPPTTTPLRVDLGAFIDKRLPNGVTLRIPTNGVESRLIAFIEDPTRRADKETWFSFDRLEFETDSATLRPSSQEQLRNIAEIMKAYPNVNAKIGGYTDNVGEDAYNMKLSTNRARNTEQEIVKLGVNDARLEAEGYGEQHPVADNATEEGRQRNRRIDIRVTKK